MKTKTFTQAEFDATPGSVVHHAIYKGPATVVNDAGEPVFTIGGSQTDVAHDPADDAAWPLPEGWSWWRQFVATDDNGLGIEVDVDGVAVCRVYKSTGRAVPLAVVRTLLARWEAGQA